MAFAEKVIRVIWRQAPSNCGEIDSEGLEVFPFDDRQAAPFRQEEMAIVAHVELAAEISVPPGAFTEWWEQRRETFGNPEIDRRSQLGKRELVAGDAAEQCRRDVDWKQIRARLATVALQR